MDKDSIIKDICYDKSGYSSIQKTYIDAKEKEPSITLKNVKDWFSKNLEKTTQLKGYNSYINNEAFEEFQIDLAFFKAGELDPALIIIDTFSKYATVIPMKGKTPLDIITGIMEGFVKMGGKPKILYSDNEGAFNSKLFREYCDGEKIKSITTRTHAWVAERFIRTLKNMINKRIENNTKSWKDVLYEVLLTYNNKDIHSSMGMTPAQAKLKENTLQVKLNLELHRVHTRRYPDVNIDDEVKLYKKKDIFDKENKSVWLKTKHKVENITQSHGQKYYHLEGHSKPYLRHELLKL